MTDVLALKRLCGTKRHATPFRIGEPSVTRQFVLNEQDVPSSWVKRVSSCRRGEFNSNDNVGDEKNQIKRSWVVSSCHVFMWASSSPGSAHRLQHTEIPSRHQHQRVFDSPLRLIFLNQKGVGGLDGEHGERLYFFLPHHQPSRLCAHPAGDGRRVRGRRERTGERKTEKKKGNTLVTF